MKEKKSQSSFSMPVRKLTVVTNYIVTGVKLLYVCVR